VRRKNILARLGGIAHTAFLMMDGERIAGVAEPAVTRARWCRSPASLRLAPIILR
jgi:hypothetical protein